MKPALSPGGIWNDEELLPIFDPKDGTIIDIAARTRAHTDWLCHGHVNVWIPGKKPGRVFVQTKIKSHGKHDATIWWHIDTTKESFWELMGRNIAELGPKTAIKEWREETGLLFTENDIIPLWSFTEVHTTPHPESNRWNNGITIAYMLNRRIVIDDILRNTNRESGLDFEEVSIETLLGLTEKDTKYLRKLAWENYKGILLTLREKMKQV